MTTTKNKKQRYLHVYNMLVYRTVQCTSNEHMTYKQHHLRLTGTTTSNWPDYWCTYGTPIMTMFNQMLYAIYMTRREFSALMK